MLSFSFDLSLIINVLSLLKKLLFYVVLLYNLPGASFFLNVQPIPKLFLLFLFLLFLFLRGLLSLPSFVSKLSVRSLFSLTFIEWWKSLKTMKKYFRVSGSSGCFSICSGKYWYFAELVLFKLKVAFLSVFLA